MKKYPDTNTLISLAALLMSLISVFYGYNANKIASEANRIAIEANTISAKANEVSSRIVTATIVADEVIVNSDYYTCKNPYNNRYYIFLLQEGNAILTNTGGLTTSLTKIELSNASYEWVKFVTNENLTEIIDLPIDIPAGTSKKIYFAALYLYGYGNTAEEAYAMDIPQPKEYETSPVWKVYFGNGQSGELFTLFPLITLYDFYPESFERNCIHPYPWRLP